MSNICVVIPTIRPESYTKFLDDWRELRNKHNITLVTVWDGDSPCVECRLKKYSIKDVMGEKYQDLIYNKNDGVRNLGFAFTARFLPEVEYVISLDDDLSPIGDSIQDHLDILQKRGPLSWISTASEYTRGFPYSVREEAEIVFSHGVWQGVKDYDAPTQLALGNKDCQFYKGTIPKGVLFPLCGMNIAFKRKLLPYVYFAPMGYKVGLDRFADIWMGINLKIICDEKGWAIASGYAQVLHNKASNVYANLVKEAKGIGLNEEFWQNEKIDPYFDLYKKQMEKWKEFINE